MSLDAISAPFSTLKAVFDTAELITKIQDVPEDARRFCRLIERVRLDYEEAVRLFLDPVIQSCFAHNPSDDRYVQHAIKDTREALNHIGKHLGALRKDAEGSSGAVSLSRRVRWLYQHQSRVVSSQLELSTCHRSLINALQKMQQYMSHGEALPLPPPYSPPPEEIAVCDDWLDMRRRRTRIERGEKVRPRDRSASAEGSADDSGLLSADKCSTEVEPLAGLLPELTPSTPFDLELDFFGSAFGISTARSAHESGQATKEENNHPSDAATNESNESKPSPTASETSSTILSPCSSTDSAASSNTSYFSSPFPTPTMIDEHPKNFGSEMGPAKPKRFSRPYSWMSIREDINLSEGHPPPHGMRSGSWTDAIPSVAEAKTADPTPEKNDKPSIAEPSQDVENSEDVVKPSLSTGPQSAASSHLPSEETELPSPLPSIAPSSPSLLRSNANKRSRSLLPKDSQVTLVASSSTTSLVASTLTSTPSTFSVNLIERPRSSLSYSRPSRWAPSGPLGDYNMSSGSLDTLVPATTEAESHEITQPAKPSPRVEYMTRPSPSKRASMSTEEKSAVMEPLARIATKSLCQGRPSMPLSLDVSTAIVEPPKQSHPLRSNPPEPGTLTYRLSTASAQAPEPVTIASPVPVTFESLLPKLYIVHEEAAQPSDGPLVSPVLGDGTTEESMCRPARAEVNFESQAEVVSGMRSRSSSDETKQRRRALMRMISGS